MTRQEVKRSVIKFSSILILGTVAAVLCSGYRGAQGFVIAFVLLVSLWLLIGGDS